MIGDIILALIAVLSIYVLRYFYRESTRRRLARSSRRRLPYRCVTIHFDPDVRCLAVTLLANRRFLSRSAPLVPLPECNRDCQCWYEHFDDRRQDDRRDYYSRMSRNYGGPERRIRSGDRRRHFDEVQEAKPSFL